MLYLLRKKTSGLIKKNLFLLFSIISLSAFSQRTLYQEDHDNKRYYFGITLAGSSSRFHTNLHSSFLAQDTVMVAEPVNAGGFALGLSATLNLTKRFEARFNPMLSFMDRNLYYKLRYKDRDLGTDVTKKVESVNVSFPMHFKFN